MRKPHFSVFLLIALMSCSSGKDEVVTPEVGPRLDPEYLAMTQMGGAASLGGSTSPGSLSAPAPNLEPATLEQHLIGDANFEMAFIPGPDTQHPLHVGLGPVFNNSSCLNCHSRDGRGVLPPLTQGESRVKLIANAALLIRLSVEGDLPRPKDEQNGWGAPLSVPGFSGQLFHRGIFTLRPDSPGTGQADIYLRFESTSFSYPDGRTLTLRKPIFDIENAYDGAQSRLYASDVRTSPRIAPAMVGLGLLEAIPEEQILARADIEDADGITE